MQLRDTFMKPCGVFLLKKKRICASFHGCKTDVRNPVKVICLHAACEHASREDVVVDSGDAGKLQALKHKRREVFLCVFPP